MGKSYYVGKEYLAGDFISEALPKKPETINDIVDKKINLLYDFCALKRKGRTDDPREADVRRILTAIGSRRGTIEAAEDAMTNALKPITRFEITMSKFIAIHEADIGG